MTTITLTLKGQLEAFVKRFGKARGLSPEDAAIELLQRHAAVEEMDELRGGMRPYFEKAGVETDEDVTRLVRELRDEHKPRPAR